MRALLVFVGVTTISATAQAGNTPDLSGILRLVAMDGVAHACPIAPDLALTNAHVTSGHTSLVWATREGSTGLIRRSSTYRYRDLATVSPEEGSPFPRVYPLAKEAPKAGEKVYFIGYDFRTRKAAFSERVFESKVLRSLAGHLVMATPGVPGSSGSCVINERGEVVAINAGGKSTGDGKGDPEWVGIAVEVWGSWLETGK